MLSGARLVRLLGPGCTVLAAHGGFCFGAALVGTKEGINLLRLKYTLGCPYPGQPCHCFIIDFIQHNAGAGGGCSAMLCVVLTRCAVTSAQWQSLSAGSTYLLSTSRASSTPPQGLLIVTASKYSTFCRAARTRLTQLWRHDHTRHFLLHLHLHCCSQSVQEGFMKI